MLSESSYLTGLYAYIGAAIVALLALAWWLRKSWSNGWIAFGVLTGAALLLTPAYPNESADTLAPALIVAVFQILTDGPEAAAHALRPLGFMLSCAVALALLLRILVFRNKSAGTPVDTGAATSGEELAQ